MLVNALQVVMLADCQILKEKTASNGTFLNKDYELVLISNLLALLFQAVQHI
jgi:hypothetical protein